jgi:hypothetical protein
MYGKHFESMYEGSMYGAGVAVFAVWGYVISHARGGVVELNPKKLADTLGGEVGEIVAAIKKLESPDPGSRHKDEDGKRLIKEGEYQYRVPSWDYYQKLRDAADLREYNREAKRRQREADRKAREQEIADKGARPVINAAVAADPITKADKRTVKKKAPAAVNGGKVGEISAAPPEGNLRPLVERVVSGIRMPAENPGPETTAEPEGDEPPVFSPEE